MGRPLQSTLTTDGRCLFDDNEFADLPSQIRFQGKDVDVTRKLPPALDEQSPTFLPGG